MTRLCDHCRIEFKTPDKRRRFCSLKCGWAGRRQLTGDRNPMAFKRGPLNPAYKDGKWAGIKPARRLRKARCEDCGATRGRKGRGLEAHHIDMDHGNNDPSNIATLCGRCHMKRHWANDGTVAGQLYPNRRPARKAA